MFIRTSYATKQKGIYNEYFNLRPTEPVVRDPVDGVIDGPVLNNGYGSDRGYCS